MEENLTTAMMLKVVSDTNRDIQLRAQEKKADVRAYAEHVFNGGDPTEISGYDKKWEGAQQWAGRIANAYRAGRDLPAIPFSPTQATHWRLFDFMADVRHPSPSPDRVWDGEYIPVTKLHEITRRQHPTTYLKSFVLRKRGYDIEKETIDGRVHYRIVKLVAEGDNC